MGFLKKETELQMAQEYEKQAEIERDRLAREAQAAEKKLLDEEKLHAPKDNKVIIALLDSLPDFDLEKYLATVARHTQYTPDLVLYTRLALFGETERLKLLEQDQELTDKLRRKGISLGKHIVGDKGVTSWDHYEPIALLTPKAMFCGEGINPRKGLFGLIPITEPQVPGIGIRFTRVAGSTKTSENKNYRYYNVFYDAVFARFVTPATAIINGDRDGLRVTSLEVFDTAFERAFKNPCRYTLQNIESIFEGGYTGGR